MKMTKEEREEFKKILKECQDINGDNAFDKLANFICDTLKDEGLDVEIIERDNNIPPEKSILLAIEKED